MEKDNKKLRVLELFSGIGGLHWALKLAKVDWEVVGSMEINPVVIETYSHNFPDVNMLNRNLDNLTAHEINELGVDAIIMSPPCQPFCRTGLGQGLNDSRSSPLNHILQLLPSLNLSHIFIENVHGFESSDAHAVLVKTLEECNFSYQEFLINPTSLGIPNSRLRYYLIGKERSLKWSFQLIPNEIRTELPETQVLQPIIQSETEVWKEHRRNRNKNKELQEVPEDFPRCVGDVLEPLDKVKELNLRPDLAVKYWDAIDVITISSLQSCCFTKAYYSYLTGTGSFLDYTFSYRTELENTKKNEDIDVKDRKLRYFSPLEVARLMCFPNEFRFPDKLTRKQRYKALGNSVNVYVVALLLTLLSSQE